MVMQSAPRSEKKWINYNAQGGSELSDIDVKHKTFHVDRLKDGDSGPHELYNGESQAVKEWLLERVKMAPPAGVDTLFISERRKPLSRVTVWHMIGAGVQGGRPGALVDSPSHALP